MNLTSDPELRIVTRIRSNKQATVMRFLSRVAGLRLTDKSRSFAVWG